MNTSNNHQPTRRRFLRAGFVSGVAALSASPVLLAADSKKSEQEEEIAPTEDLMCEHGVLKRVVLAYGEIVHRLDARKDFPPEALADAAGIIRTFIEDYHEKLEEDFLFPRLEKAGKQIDLTRILREQHQAGRRLSKRDWLTKCTWPFRLSFLEAAKAFLPELTY